MKNNNIICILHSSDCSLSDKNTTATNLYRVSNHGWRGCEIVLVISPHLCSNLASTSDLLILNSLLLHNFCAYPRMIVFTSDSAHSSEQPYHGAPDFFHCLCYAGHQFPTRISEKFRTPTKNERKNLSRGSTFILIAAGKWIWTKNFIVEKKFEKKINALFEHTM